jgi:hypothetical protein
MNRKNGIAVRWLVPTLVAIGITVVGWAAVNLPRKNESWLWVAVPGMFLELPGGMLAAFLAAGFSPQGFHGIDDFAWVIVPFDLLFYFLAFFFFFRRRNQNASRAKSGRQTL